MERNDRSESPAVPAQERLEARNQPVMSRLIEFYLWLFAGVVVGGRALYFVLNSPRSEAPIIIRELYWDFVLAALVAVFPIIFRLIFGALPLEYIRLQRIAQSQQPPGAALTPSPFSDGPPANPQGPAAAVTALNDELRLLHTYAGESRQLAKGIYSRAGVYLLVGVLVAFSGLAFFYAQTPGISSNTDIYPLLIALAPKFGILFFIEFVAFFFLRQYRAAMDEFRYYEGIARVREEVLGLLQISAAGGKSVSPMELVKYDSYFSRSGVLAKGQTTELLESRKLEGTELDLLQKVVDILSRSKK